jgi:hypothetical protein
MSTYRHIEWLDLDNNGILIECAIMKRFGNGDTHFFQLRSLDLIDKQRLRLILTHPNAALYAELWQLLEQHTLGNGLNALEYFNQLVKIRTPSGQIVSAGTGRRGYIAQTPGVHIPQVQQQQIPTEIVENSQANRAKANVTVSK